MNGVVTNNHSTRIFDKSVIQSVPVEKSIGLPCTPG